MQTKPLAALSSLNVGEEVVLIALTRTPGQHIDAVKVLVIIENLYLRS